MTNEQINTAIAKVCGCVHLENPSDYCNDLNAMHEAEKIFCNYSLKLEYADGVAFTCDENLRFNAIHATARQRAEAFLRTLGKWDEGK